MTFVCKEFDYVQVAIGTGQKERGVGVTSLVDCTYNNYAGVLGDEYIQGMLTSRITMTLVHKVFDSVQMAIGTGQREWGVTSLVDCAYVVIYIYHSACSKLNLQSDAIIIYT